MVGTWDRFASNNYNSTQQQTANQLDHHNLSNQVHQHQQHRQHPIKMKSFLSLALISALSLTSSAATINKVRQARDTTYSYTVTIVESNGVTSTLTSDPNGIVSASFSPSVSDFLTSASIDNPADNAQCTLKDQRGNQVRAFGGPNQGVDSVELVEADGIQVFSLYCAPV
jgi:hypothetical protein